MKIALINPMGPKYQFDDANDHLPPLGLLYLAAVVRPRHEVCVLDGELLKETGPAILKRIPFEPDLVGIGGTTSQAGEACNLARRAREKFPRARIVAGGTHATILGEEYLRECEAFDAVVRGPGEAPFAMLADGHDPATVPQVISRQGDGFRENPAQGDLDLSALPPPARDLVNIHHYTGTSNNLFRQTVIMATRGCPFRCSFCSNAVWGRRWQPRPIESVVEELKVIADLGFAEAFFQDDTLNAKPAWTLELFEALRKADLGLEYKVDFRANAALVPEPLLDAAAACGVREIFYGVESGNDAVREAAGKNLPREDILRAIRLTKERGIATLCAFIIGLPGETAETVQDTIAFAKELSPDTAGFSIATPFPGTELREQAVAEHRLMSDKYEALTTRVSVMRTAALSCQDITRLRDEASRQWEAHLRSRPVEAAKSPRALQEKSCREALARAMTRDDSLGQAIIQARLARIRMDRGDNAEAMELSVAPLGEPALSDYDRAKAGVILAIACAREGLLNEAVAALFGIRRILHPAQRAFAELVRKELTERVRQRQRAKEGDDLVRRIEALEQRLSLEGINGALHALAHRVNNGKPQAGYINQRFRDYELAIVSIKQLGNELGQRLARERLSKPVSRPAPANLKSKLCTQADIESDWSAFWRQEIKWAPVYHRKLWELTYVPEVLYAAGKLKPGRQGLGFGCGEEPLPSLFVKYGTSITATDLPPDNVNARNWASSAQHAGSLEKIRRLDICPDPSALARIALRFVDMNDIPRDMDGKYDFCWSVCSLEHVGSIAKGLAFIVNSLRTLKPGGVAVHTTEFNLENGPTVDNWGTVLFQRGHIEGLVNFLTSQGHKVAPLDLSAGDDILDGFVDVPPWPWDNAAVRARAHLKLCLDGFPCTSVGIIIRKADAARPGPLERRDNLHRDAQERHGSCVTSGARLQAH
ncbi:MAG: radical SAM protein [Candidatus Brocadiia bacterium]